MLRIVIATTIPANSASMCPTRKALRAIGSVRKRSTMPSFRSVASDVPGPIIPKATVCTRIPPIRYSR